MIDKRMMYAMGQRVAKTLDGSRPGYRGGGADMGSTGSSTGSSGPAGGASAGGNYGGNSSGGTSHGDMSNTGGNTRGLDRGFQNALKNQQVRQNTITQSQDPNFGQFFGTRVPTYSPMSFGNKVSNVFGGIGDFVGDYISGGGIIGAGIRGLGNLFGPPTASTGNVGPAGIKTDGTYGTVGDAINAGRRNEPPREEGQGIMNLYNPNMLNVAGPVVEDETIETGDGEMEEFIQRFKVKDDFRQAKGPERLIQDQAIAKMISRLYT